MRAISERAASNPHNRRAFDDGHRIRRGFLPRGLSNTCPSGRCASDRVSSDGQVSDKPKLERVLSIVNAGYRSPQNPCTAMSRLLASVVT